MLAKRDLLTVRERLDPVGLFARAIQLERVTAHHRARGGGCLIEASHVIGMGVGEQDRVDGPSAPRRHPQQSIDFERRVHEGRAPGRGAANYFAEVL